MNFENLLQALPEQSSVFQYGSQVYGTATAESDYDLQIILPDNIAKKADWKNKLKQWNLDLHVWSQSDFQQALDDHRVYALECYYTPVQKVLRNNLKLDFKLNKSMLRSSFSQVASNSWVKAKKKLIVEADYNEHIAKKSIFHSFRILDFGIQLAKYGCIVKYHSMNDVLAEINQLPSDWDMINATFRERHNNLSSQFREVCPK